jgi:hypothetical protein
MKALLILVVFVLAAAPAARAVINPGENIIGPYFDLEADQDCIEGIEANAQIPVHIILTRPTFSELYGFELGLDYDSSLILLDRVFPSQQVLDMGTGDNLIVGFGQPWPTSEATLLVTLSILHMGSADAPASLTLRGSQPSSLDPDYPTVLYDGDQLLSTGLHSDYRPFPYLINGRCGFEDEGRTWDGVKTLYRR